MLYRVNWVRGFVFLAVLVRVGIAGVRSGGWQGRLFGAVCFLIAVATGMWWWRRRDER